MDKKKTGFKKKLMSECILGLLPKSNDLFDPLSHESFNVLQFYVYKDVSKWELQ